ncbi:chymotrypsin inhibitor-like [Harpegnathos saltator]|uniref:chymotrypsin inhibitor-like n=1 Tax=Harpegnathos saltator TaxID=610380 RepID=UPI000DBEDB0B|nr:chymotrypsin inhibitor-like [Harpegnathos saltator]
MSRASLVLLVAIAVLFSTATSQSARRCPPNQEWTTCGSACPPSCNSRPDQVCTLQCVIGCQCRPGLLLNSRGECVPPSQC